MDWSGFFLVRYIGEHIEGGVGDCERVSDSRRGFERDLTRRIGVFGGTFDPIHVGHLAAAEDAAWRLNLDEVLFVPNNVPPHKRDRQVSKAKDRLAMVRQATSGNPLFRVSEIEIARTGPSYTIDTLRELARYFGESASMLFLTGQDALSDLHSWHQPDQLLQEFEVIFLCRPEGRELDWNPIEARFPGLRSRVDLVRIPQLEISGSDIRARVREGRPIRYYVTEPVENYILSQGLYRSD